jgi:hypothetical protein
MVGLGGLEPPTSPLSVLRLAPRLSAIPVTQCRRSGIERVLYLHQGLKLARGETMSKATYPLKLPLSIKKAAQRLAKEDGVSLNQWIAAAVAEKVGVVETADFFRKQAGKATGEGLMKFLRTAPKLAPEAEDTHR